MQISASRSANMAARFLLPGGSGLHVLRSCMGSEYQIATLKSLLNLPEKQACSGHDVQLRSFCIIPKSLFSTRTMAEPTLPCTSFGESALKLQHEVTYRTIPNFHQIRNAHFVQSVLEEYEKSQQKMREKARDVVHFNLCNNTFVTVSDESGRTVKSISAGHLKDVGRLRSKFATEAIAEHVGQLIKTRGRPIIVKVKGVTFFSRKKAAILGLRKGLGRRSLITYVEDVTRLPHGGCRLRKRRRI